MGGSLIILILFIAVTVMYLCSGTVNCTLYLSNFLETNLDGRALCVHQASKTDCTSARCTIALKMRFYVCSFRRSAIIALLLKKTDGKVVIFA